MVRVRRKRNEVVRIELDRVGKLLRRPCRIAVLKKLRSFTEINIQHATEGLAPTRAELLLFDDRFQHRLEHRFHFGVVMSRFADRFSSEHVLRDDAVLLN